MVAVTGSSPPDAQVLSLVNEVGATVLLPALLRRFGTERLFFTVADGLYIFSAYSALYQRSLDRTGAGISQGQVVLSGSTLIAVPLDGEPNRRMLPQEINIGLHSRLLVGANIALVVFEVDVLHAGGKQLLFTGGGRGAGCCRRRRSYGDPGSGFLSAPGSFRGQLIRG